MLEFCLHCRPEAALSLSEFLWDLPTPFTIRLQVTPEDIDGMSHVNNACYIVWCEQCAWRHSEALGLTVQDYLQLNRGVAIRQAHYDYFAPGLVDDPLVIATWLTECDGKLRLQRRFQICHAKSGISLMRGHWNLICINVKTGKPTRFPQTFIEIYGNAVIRAEDSKA